VIRSFKEHRTAKPHRNVRSRKRRARKRTGNQPSCLVVIPKKERDQLFRRKDFVKNPPAPLRTPYSYRTLRCEQGVLAWPNLGLPRIVPSSYHAAAVQATAAANAWMHGGAMSAIEATGIRTMPRNAILTLRVVVTLACLVGVPVVALVGVPSVHQGSGKFGVSAEQPMRTPPRAATAHGAPSPGNRPVSDLNSAALSDPLPKGTIHEISVDHSPVQNSPVQSPPAQIEPHDERQFASRVNPAAFEARAASDTLTQQLQRLQELGASYYRLECSPNAVADYAFHCRIAGVDQPFAATASTPTAAVSEVIRAIEAWRAHPPETRTHATSVYQR
jgi:hypothetical protein